MAHDSFVLLLTHLCIGNQGRKLTVILFQIQIILLDASGIIPREKNFFMELIFLWVFEMQVPNKEDKMVTAADVAVEGRFLVMP